MANKEDLMQDAKEEFDHLVNLMIDDGPEELAKLIYQPIEIAKFILDVIKKEKAEDTYEKYREEYAEKEYSYRIEEE